MKEQDERLYVRNKCLNKRTGYCKFSGTQYRLFYSALSKTFPWIRLQDGELLLQDGELLLQNRKRNLLSV